MQTEIESINDIITFRLLKTTQIYKGIKKEFELELIPKFFTSYYLDFSTGIEYITDKIIRDKYDNEPFLFEKIINKNGHTSMLSPVWFSKLIDTYYPIILWSEYKEFCKNNLHKIKDNDFPTLANNYMIDFEMFISAYGNAYKTRNQVAHSFVTSNISYKINTLLEFLLAYFGLYKIYDNYRLSVKKL